MPILCVDNIDPAYGAQSCFKVRRSPSETCCDRSIAHNMHLFGNLVLKIKTLCEGLMLIRVKDDAQDRDLRGCVHCNCHVRSSLVRIRMSKKLVNNRNKVTMEVPQLLGELVVKLLVIPVVVPKRLVFLRLALVDPI